jgi:hypothetical protein
VLALGVLVPEKPYLEVAIVIFRDADSDMYEASVRIGKQEVTHVTGVDIADVVTAASNGIVRYLAGR